MTDKGTVATLLPGNGSDVDELAVALTATTAGAGLGNGQASIAVKVTTADSPTTIVAFEQLSAIFAGETTHVQPAGAGSIDEIVIPAGNGTETTGLLTTDGPLLATAMRYVMPPWPAVPVFGPVIEIARSDAGGCTPT